MSETHDIGSASAAFDLMSLPERIAEIRAKLAWIKSMQPKPAAYLGTLRGYNGIPITKHTPPPPCPHCKLVAGAHWGTCPNATATVIQPESQQIQRIKSAHKGREVKAQGHAEYRAPKKATLPARSLRLPDGRLLVYQTPDHSIAAAGGWWVSADGLKVIATIDPDPVWGNHLHVSLSYYDRDPSWEDILQIRYVFYPIDIDVMMVLPMDGHYVNNHTHTFQMRPTPERWSTGPGVGEKTSVKTTNPAGKRKRK